MKRILIACGAVLVCSGCSSFKLGQSALPQIPENQTQVDTARAAAQQRCGTVPARIVYNPVTHQAPSGASPGDYTCDLGDKPQ